jgi:hypothetical protein
LINKELQVMEALGSNHFVLEMSEQFTQIRSVLTKKSKLGNSGVEPGAGGFGFYLPALKTGLVEKRSKQEAAKSVLVFTSNWGSLFFEPFGGRQCTSNGQIFDKTDKPTGSGAR